MTNLALTYQKLRQMTDDAERGREEELHRTVSSDFLPPGQIYEQLQRDVTDSIFKKEKKTQFFYEVNRYYRIFGTFGREDTWKAIMDAAIDYRDAHFPTAFVEIDASDSNYCVVLLYFTLPWLSGQTSSRLPPA